ncbi:MAG: hypothetical protein PWQ75_2634 [Methanolobus sp.]|jgi:hypothetical protein|uniref:Uncharacterized protein n=1 Tax=Methanolobus tindarius DSM 2278 TaxID=1090322 RepID=W9DP91_METTI|nr:MULTISPECIES: hypothetical protein [Methanolobus]ETA68049.1 hypothetical protein MettiDRAFT_1496 [Methanolobus tindarius DSM 2278]MDI3486460.1 hypothetical protein [Methanolobus sp.]MDK2832882.1 hypothetical protein [Methanolobus sp.]
MKIKTWKIITIFLLAVQLFVSLQIDEWEIHAKSGFGELTFQIGLFMGLLLGVSVTKIADKYTKSSMSNVRNKFSLRE